MHWIRFCLDFDETLAMREDCASERSGDAAPVRLRFQLPCPAADLLEPVNWVKLVPAGELDTRTLHRWLRQNPTLLLMALVAHHRATGQAAISAGDLVEGGHRRAVQWLADQPLPVSRSPLPAKVWQQKFWKRYLRARSHRRLRSCLNAWLKQFSGLTASERKLLLATVLDGRLRADQFPTQGLRRSATRKAILQQWRSRSSLGESLSPIFQVVGELIGLRERYDQQLIRDKLSALKELAYGASHEINNPLANIATRAQTLLAQETHPDKRHKLGVMYQQAMRAHEMISDMMLFAHPPRLQCRLVSLRLLMRKLVSEHSARIEQMPGLNWRVILGPDVDQMLLDPTQFLVALNCLLNNSLEAIQSGPGESGNIELRIDRVEADSRNWDPAASGGQRGVVPAIRVSIWDDGVGIEPRVAAHLFDPFFSGREAGRGLGFGLSKVWRITELHGGQILLDPDCHEGTRFLMWLPLVADQRLVTPLAPMKLSVNAAISGPSVADVA